MQLSSNESGSLDQYCRMKELLKTKRIPNGLSSQVTSTTEGDVPTGLTQTAP